MKMLLFLVAAAVAVSACGGTTLNDRACANHPAAWCGVGKVCLVVGNQSMCAPIDAGTGGASGSGGHPNDAATDFPGLETPPDSITDQTSGTGGTIDAGQDIFGDLSDAAEAPVDTGGCQ